GAAGPGRRGRRRRNRLPHPPAAHLDRLAVHALERAPDHRDVVDAPGRELPRHRPRQRVQRGPGSPVAVCNLNGLAPEPDGTLMIACNCDYGCPCNVNGLPTTGDCEGGWTWHIEKGRYGGTALDGLNFSVFADWPGAIHEGGGRAVAYVDERADEAQEQALTR